MRSILNDSTANKSQIAKQLNRGRKSIWSRIERLKNQGSKIVNKPVTLEEDFIIIDSVVEKLISQKDQKLSEVKLEIEEIGKLLVRQHMTIYKRWEGYLKIWLLGYYRRTLNLEIRMMLANCLADNFKDIDSIDWVFVSSIRDFQGHTEISLRKTFSNLLLNAVRQLKVNRTEISLKQIAENANVRFCAENAKKTPEKIEVRQMRVIEYFEDQVKKFGIKDFL